MPLNKKLTEDPATKFDRTNIGDGIYQMRELITQALAPTSPLLRGEIFEAIALWVSPPTLITPFVGGTFEGPLGASLHIPEMKIKMILRSPLCLYLCLYHVVLIFINLSAVGLFIVCRCCCAGGPLLRVLVLYICV